MLKRFITVFVRCFRDFRPDRSPAFPSAPTPDGLLFRRPPASLPASTAREQWPRPRRASQLDKAYLRLNECLRKSRPITALRSDSIPCTAEQ